MTTIIVTIAAAWLAVLAAAVLWIAGATRLSKIVDGER